MTGAQLVTNTSLQRIGTVFTHYAGSAPLKEKRLS